MNETIEDDIRDFAMKMRDEMAARNESGEPITDASGIGAHQGYVVVAHPSPCDYFALSPECALAFAKGMMDRAQAALLQEHQGRQKH